MFEQIQVANRTLHHALDGLAARQQAINHNLSNADTPGYQAIEVDFESQLQARRREILGGMPEVSFQTRGAYTDPDHLPLGLPEDSIHTLVSQVGVMRNDNNGVDLEQEMAKMAQAQIAYQAVTQLMGGRYGQLKHVIAEGGR